MKKIRKLTLRIFACYILLWTTTETLGVWQCNSKVDELMVRHAQENNLGEAVRLQNAEELISHKIPKSFGYYRRAFSPAPFWIILHTGANRSPDEKLSVAWFFGYLHFLKK